MNKVPSTLSALAISATLLVPGVSQAKVYQSIQKSQLQSYTTQAKQEACEKLGNWLSHKLLQEVDDKVASALHLPEIVTISITQDPHSEIANDYTQETSIDGAITKEPIRLDGPTPLKDFFLKLEG
jgi:hypothetical protein